MKKLLLFGAFAFIFSGFVSGASVTITNSGFTFSPDNVTINVGDTVNFQLGASHNAVEVNETTWNANGSTLLDGGFATAYGGGQVTGLAAGVHFYVCEPHASGGMKGKITVTGPSGTNDLSDIGEKISIYPNPTNGKFTLQINASDGFAGIEDQTRLEIFNMLGKKIADVPEFISQASTEIDLSSIPDGIYFIRINDRNKVYTQQLIKQ